MTFAVFYPKALLPSTVAGRSSAPLNRTIRRNPSPRTRNITATPRLFANEPHISGIICGRGVSRSLGAWQEITSDSWVLEVVKGYHLELATQPVQSAPVPSGPIPQRQQLLIGMEIGELLQKKAVELVAPSEDQFVSRIFLVPKKDGSYRPVFNLRPLNRFMENSHFKMEGLPAVKELLQRDDWLCTMDLKDAYLSVAVVQDHRKFLRFTWEGKTLQFTCLPFGLSSAPRVFTKLLRPVMALLRRQGLRSVIIIIKFNMQNLH